MIVLRTARVSDLDALHRLAVDLDTVNLPADRDALHELLVETERVASPPPSTPGPERYVFVLEDDGDVLGTSMIIASHGIPGDPHHYFRLDTEDRYSRTLDRVFQHRLLCFQQSFTPHTELAGLILDAPHRGRPDRPGRLLVYGRLLFIAAHRASFREELQAELLPPFEPDGSSVLWEWIGRRFTGLRYNEADRLSRTEPEFMRALFPHAPILVDLLPERVQAVIGVTGGPTRGVEELLRRAGFRFNGNVDPFDGGPHLAAATDHVAPIRDALDVAIEGGDPGPDAAVHLVATRTPFRAVRCRARLCMPDTLIVPDEALRALVPEPVPCALPRGLATREPQRPTGSP